jgi:probable rRNA maturation factor
MSPRGTRSLPDRRRDEAGIAVDVARDGVTVPVSSARVREIVRAVCEGERVRAGMVSLTFVTNRVMAKMHREFLGHRGATDIITFELDAADGVTMGDIYIAPDVARANARAHGVGVREEMIRLVIHGTLHVLGYTHPEDERTASVMWRKQEEWVAAFA